MLIQSVLHCCLRGVALFRATNFAFNLPGCFLSPPPPLPRPPPACKQAHLCYFRLLPAYGVEQSAFRPFEAKNRFARNVRSTLDPLFTLTFTFGEAVEKQVFALREKKLMSQNSHVQRHCRWHERTSVCARAPAPLQFLHRSLLAFPGRRQGRCIVQQTRKATRSGADHDNVNAISCQRGLGV